MLTVALLAHVSTGAQVFGGFLALVLAWAIIGGIRDARRQARLGRRRGYIYGRQLPYRKDDWRRN